MAKRDWALIRELSSALGRSNSPRTLPKVIGEALQEDWNARQVRLVLIERHEGRFERRSFEAALKRGRWLSQQSVDQPRRLPVSNTLGVTQQRSGHQLVLPIRVGSAVGELRCWFGHDGNQILDDSSYLATLSRLVEVGIGYQQLVGRVADLSQGAYAENRKLRTSLERSEPGDLVVRSVQMREVQERIDLVAKYDTAVLVRGESGVGKELVSREIHRRSSRSRRRFVQINCGAIPAQLVESELFGHEKGAFTGAERTHQGVFEQANGGVLFLDEIGDLPLDAQVKLLRVVQEGRVRRVGSEIEIEVDVRIVAATNRGLEEMVASGEFRQDLYYRLNVFPIEVPPLRERSEDIAVLVDALVKRLAVKLGIGKPTIPKAVMSRLKSYSWPGNVRQLANVLEASIILGDGHSLELPVDFASRAVTTTVGPPANLASLDETIRAAIANALRSTNGKIYGDDGAAAVLALHPATLQSKMRKLGVVRSDFVDRASSSQE